MEVVELSRLCLSAFVFIVRFFFLVAFHLDQARVLVHIVAWFALYALHNAVFWSARKVSVLCEEILQ